MAYSVFCVSFTLRIIYGQFHFNSNCSICCSCAQCFRPFQDGIFYEFEGRKYCERDFHVLFAPCCNKCGEFVIGRVIKAMAASWHPTCFCCESCHKELADCGFIRNQVRDWMVQFKLKSKSKSQSLQGVSLCFFYWKSLKYCYRIVPCVMIAMPERRLANWADTFATNASKYSKTQRNCFIHCF